MPPLHVQIETTQEPKRPGAPCGDVLLFDRSELATLLVCCDGLGSGIRANIAANVCAARLMQLMRGGASPREAFTAVARTMHEAAEADLPYAAFSITRIMSDGAATVLTYEMPGPLLLGPRHSELLPQEMLSLGGVPGAESRAHLEAGEGLLIVSDGITQAGMGSHTPRLPYGWTEQGLNRYVNGLLADGLPFRRLVKEVLRRARELNGGPAGDDCTVVAAGCRVGKVLNLLTGPGAPDRDAAVVRQFMRMEGDKVVCGGTTANIVARCLGRPLTMEQELTSFVAPPSYGIEGVDLVTEGAVTLNQVFNLLEEDETALASEQSGVTQLVRLLRHADRVNILLGAAVNPATADISFRQQGIITRSRIVRLIADKLREMGKLVVAENI